MLAVDDLVAGYRGHAVARLGYLSLRGGEAAVLAGASGAGKTTLLLAIAGLADRLSGSVHIAEEEVTRLKPRARDRHRGRHIGLIFQDLHLVPGLSALDNLLLAPYATGARQDRIRAARLLEGLGLAARMHAPAEKLSRDEAQRTAIARAMLMEPQLILADEPTASLDDEACEAVLSLLLRATEESDAALVIATHDARVKARLANVATVEPA
ncbi:ATP-binding cassette domain-containing protein [Sphingomonas sp. dw_22]|uniref:ABC transporter ATP-binding protein n=1 Tax=Sphingomonas sp. dw_22 TaxID=2721175 RepID=UPI001BD692DC|nr:ATP-binding cassette domain-containing protein [Sphingomonas sp. dw_22]